MSTETLMLLNDSSASNLISGKNCLNPVNEFEDLQYKMATMQALRYMAKQDSLKNIEQQRTVIKLSKSRMNQQDTTPLNTGRELSPTGLAAFPLEIPQKVTLPQREMLLDSSLQGMQNYGLP